MPTLSIGREGTSALALGGLAELWQQTLGDPSICIAVLDGPADLSHPALSGARLAQHDPLGRGGVPGTLGREHGTHIASVIFGQHDGPIKGVAPNCRGVIIPIYDDEGAQPSCSQRDLAKAISEAVRLGAHVINISGGELSENGQVAPDLRLAIRTCVDENRVIVAAAGNEGCQECLHVPGAVPSVLAVGAMDGSGDPLPNSNWGDIYRLQGVLAPGQDIVGARPGGGIAPRSGTSFAAAIASGVAGLLLSLQTRRGEQASPFWVREALVRTAQGCEREVSAACDRLLAGRLNVPGAVQFLTQGVPHMMPETSARSGCQPAQESRAAGRSGAAPDGGHADTVDVHEAERSHGSAEQVSASAIGSPQGDVTQVDRAPSVTPACGCGCQGGPRQRVYVIGELDIDLVSPARRDSMQANFPRLPSAFGLDATIDSRAALLRYLLGTKLEAQGVRLNGNFYDAESVHWVLKQGECPLYAIQPQGSFAEATYHQLAIFLIEQTFRDLKAFTDEAINDHCLDEFYACYGGTQEPFRDSLSRPEASELAERRDEEPAKKKTSRRGAGKPERRAGEGAGGEDADGGVFASQDAIDRAFDMFGEPRVAAARVVIAGEVIGRTRLYSGEEVEVIAPVMRGMQNWNTRRLVQLLLRSPVFAGLETQATMLILKIVSRLYELVRNPGKDPCDRARNYVATTELFNIGQTLVNPSFLSMLGALGASSDTPGLAIDVRELLNISLDDLQCKAARCTRFGSDPYEVELSFYNFANQFMGSAVLSRLVDVSDDVPVPLERARVFPRRS